MNADQVDTGSVKVVRRTRKGGSKRRFPSDARCNLQLHAPTIVPLEFQKLFSHHKASLKIALCRRFGDPPPDPDDAIQSAILKFMELKQRDKVQNVGAFLYAMARNSMLDELRRMKVRALHKGQVQREADDTETIDARTPETVLLDQERFIALNAAIQSLPEGARKLLVLSRIENLSYSQISSQTGLSRAYISRSIQKSMKVLLEYLKKNGVEDA